ncbi:hypothetical protein BC374_25485 [Ensifer sp. LC13]|nr:hypothetical protein BBX50_25465 [Ensifer sp. LC11]OCP04677.1 hypothetical protein BC374_25485 [Ensifer sp. LC13]OCP13326.1 hypothetical protein BC362_05375 [Ensifer sp. LC14]OCP30501.1 hypothetical protein BC364_25500 [Ensifer sp. LC499]
MYWAAYSTFLLQETACPELVQKVGARYFTEWKAELLKDAEHDGYSRNQVVSMGTMGFDEMRPKLGDEANRTKFCADAATSQP